MSKKSKTEPMQEPHRLGKLFEDLYHGHPWIDVTIIETLKNILPEQAAKKIAPERNSIWQIVHHLTRWREHILLRLKGNEPDGPYHNYFTEVTDTSASAWEQMITELEHSQKDWIDYLNNMDVSELQLADRNNTSYYELIYGILQHDAYHLGQIVLLTKLN